MASGAVRAPSAIPISTSEGESGLAPARVFVVSSTYPETFDSTVFLKEQSKAELCRGSICSRIFDDDNIILPMAYLCNTDPPMREIDLNILECFLAFQFLILSVFYYTYIIDKIIGDFPCIANNEKSASIHDGTT